MRSLPAKIANPVRPETKESRHRQRKRELEVDAILRVLEPMLSTADPDQTQVLEFGAGAGFQAPFLRRLGKVTCTDLEVSEALRRIPGIETVACDIADAPFETGRFDVVFSNHVIEHLENLNGSFRELRRIGKTECVYAFAVPTSLWLVLSVPAQYWAKLSRLRVQTDTATPSAGGNAESPARRSFPRRLLPRGHGVEGRFWACYRQFRISSWQKLFEQNELRVLRVQPLLLYGPSEFPVIPTRRPLAGFCSSVLFVMKKSGA